MKGNEIHFGYKLHQKTDIVYCLIREIETSSASLHDSQIDLSCEGEVVLRDRGYFGMQAKGNDFTISGELLTSLLMNSIKNATG
jgi:IS5 family transposase